MKKSRILIGIILVAAWIFAACAGETSTTTPTGKPDTTATSATSTPEGEAATSTPEGVAATSTPGGEAATSTVEPVPATPSQDRPTAEADATPTGLIGTLAARFGGLKDLVNVVVGEPPEVTARFLPDDTLVYFTINREPGAGQLAKARNIRDIFDGTLNYTTERDELATDIEDETGIDVLSEVYDWIGSDLTFALLDLRQKDRRGNPCCDLDWVVLVQTKDRTASENFLRDLVRFLEDEEFLQFAEAMEIDAAEFVAKLSQAKWFCGTNRSSAC